jgi:predicted RNase H-like HicB family nuclease
MKLTLELDREDDGRFIAEVVELPGVMAYGQTHEEAIAKAQVLALRVLADKLEHGEIVLDPAAVSFATATAA